MSIKYGFYRTPVPNDREDKQHFHARFIRTGRTNLERLSKLVESKTKYNIADIKGVLEGFIYAFQLELEVGMIIKLDGIGTFYPTLMTQTETNDNGQTEQTVKVKSVGFRCCKKLRQKIQDTKLEKVKQVEVRGFTNEERENRILEYLKDKLSISTRTAMLLNQCSREKARADVKKLMEENKIIKVGSGNQVLYILPYPK